VRIDIAVFDGVDELDALGPLEVLRAAALSARLDVRLVTREHQDLVEGAFGLRFAPDGEYDAAADVLVVPGGGWVARAPVGAWGEVQAGEWPRLVAAAVDRGALVTSVCTGAMILGHAGVLTGRRATTHHGARADLAALGVEVVDERVVDAGGIVTAAGVTSGIDLALHLVARLVSPAAAAAGARRMEWREDGR
jgi:transcriptional regulator GlxA family with amidase domain